MPFVIVSQRRLFAETLIAALSQNGLDVSETYQTLSEVPDRTGDATVILHLIQGARPEKQEVQNFRHRTDGCSLVILASSALISELGEEYENNVDALITDDLSTMSLIGLLSAVQQGFRVSLPNGHRRVDPPSGPVQGSMADGPAVAARSGQLIALAPRQVAASPSLDEITRQTKLSAREMAVIRSLKDGASNKDIAKTLNIVENTVKVHLRSCYRKIGVKNRTQAAVWASKHLPQ